MANILDLKKIKEELRYNGMRNTNTEEARKKHEASVAENLARPLEIDRSGVTRENEELEVQEIKEPTLIKRETDADRDIYTAWEAPEYERFPKGRLWFLMLGLVTLALAAIAFYYSNYFFILFIIVAGTLVGWFGVREPKKMHFAVTSKGVRFENRIYLFDDLKSFWIFNEPPLFKELSVESKKTFMPYLRAPLGDANPDKIREALLKFLPEEKQQESFITIVSHLARF